MPDIFWCPYFQTKETLLLLSCLCFMYSCIQCSSQIWANAKLPKLVVRGSDLPKKLFKFCLKLYLLRQCQKNLPKFFLHYWLTSKNRKKLFQLHFISCGRMLLETRHSWPTIKKCIIFVFCSKKQNNCKFAQPNFARFCTFKGTLIVHINQFHEIMILLIISCAWPFKLKCFSDKIMVNLYFFNTI